MKTAPIPTPAAAPAAAPKAARTSSNPDPALVVQQFNDLAIDLVRQDARLESYAQHGRTYPHPSMEEWFTGTAGRLDDARMGFLRIHPPQGREVSQRLRHDVIDLARLGGRTGVMANQQTTFGYSWAHALDPVIDTVQMATRLLTVPPPPPAAK